MPTKLKKQLDDAAICPGGTTLSKGALIAMKERFQANGNVEAVANLFAIAGNSQRLRILLYLSEVEELCVCDLADLTGMSNTAVSAHLNKMKLQGVLKTRRSAQMIYYSIADRQRMKHLGSAFRELRQGLQEK